MISMLLLFMCFVIIFGYRLDKAFKAEAEKEPKRTKERYLEEVKEELKETTDKIESKGLIVTTELVLPSNEHQGGRLCWRVLDITNKHTTLFFDSDLLIKFEKELNK